MQTQLYLPSRHRPPISAVLSEPLIASSLRRGRGGYSFKSKPGTIPEPPQSPPTSTSFGLGVFFDGGRPPATQEPIYVAWSNRFPDVNMDFSHGGNGSLGINGNWTFLTSPNTLNGFYDEWGLWLNSHPTRRFDMALGMQPWSTSATGSSSGTSGDLLDEVEAGLHNSKIASWASQMVGFGILRADRITYIRLGWEMDGRFFPWGVGLGAPGAANYPGAWRKFVEVIRNTVGGAIANNIKFCFCPTYHGWGNLTLMNSIWPGDAHVDLVGSDLYNSFTGFYANPPSPPNFTTRLNAWNNYVLPRLNNQNNFAIAHNKRQMIGEWGAAHTIVSGGVDVGGGDDPDWVDRCYAWFTSHNSSTTGFEYINHYDDDVSSTEQIRISDGSFPLAGADFLALFSPLPHPW